MTSELYAPTDCHSSRSLAAARNCRVALHMLVLCVSEWLRPSLAVVVLVLLQQLLLLRRRLLHEQLVCSWYTACATPCELCFLTDV